MSTTPRRDFLETVGRGLLLASVGPTLCAEMGLATVNASDDAKPQSTEKLEPLIAILQETAPEKLLPVLSEKHHDGLSLKDLTAAAAFANARTFGGEDYYGFHTFMALAPAYTIARELPKAEQPLPIWKVLYRNAVFAARHGGHKNDVLQAVDAVKPSRDANSVRQAVNRGDGIAAEQALLGLACTSPEDALDGALLGVQDNHDVHSAVLPWRAWAMLDIVGPDHAATLLRQSVRQTAKRAKESRETPENLARVRKVLPALLDQHKLNDGPTGKGQGDDAWLQTLCEAVLTSKPEQAGGTVATALAEGFSPEQVGEAISLAANQLVLRQVELWGGASYGRRTHGDSPGVHMSDETNAWRNMARVSRPRQRAAGLVLAAIDIAKHYDWSMASKPHAGHEKLPFPWKEHVADVKVTTAKGLLQELDGAIRENNQIRACALVQCYGERAFEPKDVFALLRKYAISEDGRLHGEKFYQTVSEEFSTTRSAFRWRHLMALARVTASSYGFNQQDKQDGRAPGYDKARKLLRLA